MIKKLFLALVILVLVVIVAAIAVVMLVDVNRFKPQIEAAVAEQTGRKLTIDGDLSLSLYPRLALALPKTTLSEADGKGDALQIGGAGVGVALLPLFSGKLQAEVVRLEGLRLKLVRFKDGSTSFDDLIKGKGADQGTGGPGSGGAGAPLSEIRVGGLELIDARIMVDDRQRGDQLTISGLNLRAGEIASGVLTPIELTARLNSTASATDLSFEMRGELKPDLPARALSVPKLSTKVSGTVGGMAIEQTQTVMALRADAKAVSAESSSITLDFEQPGQRRLALTIAAPLQVDLAGPKISFKPFKGQLQIDDKAVAPQPLSLPFQGELLADVGAETVKAALRVDAPDTRLDATADVAGFAKPRIRFALDADRIDVDRYLPPSDPAKTPPADAGGKAGSQSLFAAVDPIPVDLSALRDLNLAGTLRVGQLKAAGLSIAKLAGDLAASGGVFTLKSLSADLYGGRADVRGSARAQGNRVALATKLTGVNIGPLLKDLTGDTMLEGLASTTIDLAAEGATVGAMRRSVDGSIKLAMTDGAVLGINLGQKLREARHKLGGAGTEAAALDRTQKTDFASLSASFNVRDGVATGDDLEAKSPLLRVGGKGVIDLVRESLDYTVKASVVATSKGQGGADLAELQGLTVPVVLSGALAAPQWKIDWESVARQAIESRAGEKLKQQLEPAKAEAEARIAAEKEALKAREDELKAKARDKLGDKLKGLLTR